jgi:hypothetical protein
MKLWERLQRWWKPGEYDEERRPADGEGHPLTAEERREDTPYSFQDELAKLGGTTAGGEPIEPDSDRPQE